MTFRSGFRRTVGAARALAALVGLHACEGGDPPRADVPATDAVAADTSVATDAVTATDAIIATDIFTDRPAIADAGSAPDAAVADRPATPDAPANLDATAPADTPTPVADTPVTPTDAPAGVGPAVWTNRNDNSRSAAVTNETALTVAAVSSSRFGLLFSRAVVGQIYAQPLYVPSVNVPGRGARPVVFVATAHNMVYAFDAADPAAAAPFWSMNLGPSVPNADVGDPAPCPDMSPEIGITATPVIDLATSTLYVEAKSKEAGAYVHRLHALDLATGAERGGSPTVIAATVPGTGAGSVGGMLAFDNLHQHSRPGLLLVNGTVYMAFASHCDREPYHGWILGYDAATLRPSVVYNTTVNGESGGIWQSGMGLSADAAGDIYYASGNGTFAPTATPPQMGNSAVRLRRAGATLAMVDWFTPFNQSSLNEQDYDFGSTGVELLPGNLALVGSKQGHLYLFNRDRMGHFNAAGDTQIEQNFLATANEEYSNIHGAPVFWASPGGTLAYVWGESDYLRAYRFDGGRFATTPAATSTAMAGTGMPGGMLAVSSNGSAAGSGVVWASIPIDMDANMMTVPGVLRAFDAADVTRELWNSERTPADSLGSFAKFVIPTVAGGRVYMATFSNRLNVYGLR
ncbi:MAG: Pyrrolo-quinoline quinone [Myxococcaceae bacterium]|nr:Pyrrolo-quinoline quinone [Myxococcaceae bacterium]